MNTYEVVLVTVNTVVLAGMPLAHKLANTYLGKYVEEKAKNLATKEDFGELLR